MHDPVDICCRIDRLVGRVDRRDNYGQLLASDGPVRRLALVLRPEREMHATLEVVRAWAADSNVMLAGLTTPPRLPANCDRRSAEALAAGCDALLALGGTARCSRLCASAQRTGPRCSAVNLGTLGYLAEIDAAHLRAVSLGADRQPSAFASTANAWASRRSAQARRCHSSSTASCTAPGAGCADRRPRAA